MKQPFPSIRRGAVVFALATVLMTAIFSPFAGSVEASASDLDGSFGSNGKVVTDLFNLGESARAVAIQSDGKIVVAGARWNPPPPQTYYDVALARFNPDGSLDQTFGTGGFAVNNFFDFDEAYTVGLQSDGKIVVGGYTSNAMGKPLWLLVRYTAAGQIDMSFGANGRIKGPEFTHIFTVAIQPDDKIVWSGYASTGSPLPGAPGYILSRLNADGTSDNGFNGGCFMLTSAAMNFTTTAMALQPDGKILIGAGSSPFRLLRYNTDGTPDPLFSAGSNDGGTFPGMVAGVTAIAVQPDGRILAAGYIGETAGGPFDFALVRYNSNGSRDKKFDGDGRVTTDFFGGDDVARALVLQTDGRILAVGYAGNAGNYDFALARYNPNGSLDSSFGTDGKATTDFNGGNDKAYAAALQSDGKLVIAGNTAGATVQGALARYKGTSFDICLQDESNGNILQINPETGDYLFKNCAGTVLGGVGTLTRRGNLITLQNNTGSHKLQATIDGNTGKATATLKIFGQGPALTITDRDITNNSGTCH